ncbi:MAG: hypothetical protein GKS07_10100 [Nitrosopumilus sp.]|nr:MAG: hypothetical protein GKS07_10100 [Nitrosopumilus sp.]
MKTRLLILSSLLVLSVLGIVTFAYDDASEEKYQYTFEIKQVKIPETKKLTTHALFSYSHDDGKTFSEPIPANDLESTGGSMMVWNDQPYLTWHENGTIWMATSDDHGITFDKKQLWDGGHPRIAYFEDKLFLAWITEEPDSIHYSTSQDRGESFLGQKTLYVQKEKTSPYAGSPIPEFVSGGESIKIVWKDSTDRDYQYEHVILGDNAGLTVMTINCKENEVYASGICMTPEAKEKFLAIGETEDED